MSDKKLRRFPVGDPRASAEQYHQDMFQRRQIQTVSIRKERKGERLWRRRQQSQSNSDRAVTVEELLHKLDSFLASPNESANLIDLQSSMAADFASTNQFVNDLIGNPDLEAKNRLLIANLTKLLQENAGTNGTNDVCKALLALLVELTAFSSYAPKPSADDYYGITPLRWSDLILDNVQLMDLFLEWIREPSVSEQVIECVCIILGNLLQDSAKPIPSIMPAWAYIVQRLPSSTFLCATLISRDLIHFGTTLLRDLTPAIIANLLRESSTAMDASFIVEGLSHREEAAIQILCESLTLVSSIVTAMEDSMASSNSSVLVPLLRALRIIFKCGPHAKTLLSHASFLPTLVKILEQGVEMDSLEVASAVLSWNGTHGNDEIAITLVPALLPVLVRIITSPTASFPWKRDAAWAVCSSLHHEWSVGSHAVSRHLKGVAVTWLTTHLTVPPSDLIRSLTELLSHPDMGAVVSAIIILDVLLRTVQPMRQLFENVGGVDRLDVICERGGEGTLTELASNLAAELLDDLFETDDEEEDPSIAPSRGENEFVFGIAEPTKAFDFGESKTPGRGRGRDFTTPAWMHQS